MITKKRVYPAFTNFYADFQGFSGCVRGRSVGAISSAVCWRGGASGGAAGDFLRYNAQFTAKIAGA
jgi:hypothetical protein